MRILWVSNAPWSPTGYGTQTKATVPQLQRLGHEVAILAFYGVDGGILDWRGTRVYPKLNHRYGQDAIAPHAEHAGAELVITLMDAWVCEPDRFPRQVWAPWFPIDHAPMPDMVARQVARAFFPITMAPFGKRMCDASGLEAGYVPHAIDTSVFAPIDRRRARELTSLPQDRFIVGMVAANKGNPSRKAFAEQLRGFKLFQQQHRDAVLYLHTSTGQYERDAVNLLTLCDHLDLVPGRDVLFVDQYGYRLGCDERLMVALYNSFDVLLSVSAGEGFGVPIVEAQACGTPVIVGDWTAMSDLAFPGSLAIATGEAAEDYTPMGAYQWRVFPAAVADALGQIYAHTPERGPLRTAALAFDSVTVADQHWQPTLVEIERRMAERGRPVRPATAPHQHTWLKTGLYGPDGALFIPCQDPTCEAALRLAHTQDTQGRVVGGWGMQAGDIPLTIEDAPDGAVAKIVCKEITQSYHLDALDLQPGDVVIDIGAHVGVVSTYLAKRYAGIRIIAVEPVPANVERLRRNLVANGVADQVEVIARAVTSDGRMVAIRGDLSSNSGGSGLHGRGTVLCTVGSMTLAELVRMAGGARVALLKIDCEGAEYEILQAHDAPLDHIDRLVGEFHPLPGEQSDALAQHCATYIPEVVIGGTRVRVARTNGVLV